MANYALRVPESLLNYARQVAGEESVSMNQFFVTAIAEKVSALKTQADRKSTRLNSSHRNTSRMPSSA